MGHRGNWGPSRYDGGLPQMYIGGGAILLIIIIILVILFLRR